MKVFVFIIVIFLSAFKFCFSQNHLCDWLKTNKETYYIEREFDEAACRLKNSGIDTVIVIERTHSGIDSRVLSAHLIWRDHARWNIKSSYDQNVKTDSSDYYANNLLSFIDSASIYKYVQGRDCKFRCDCNYRCDGGYHPYAKLVRVRVMHGETEKEIHFDFENCLMASASSTNDEFLKLYKHLVDAYGAEHKIH